MMNEKIKHVRIINEQTNMPIANGGMTIVASYDENKIDVGFAVCSLKDAYFKKLGIEKAKSNIRFSASRKELQDLIIKMLDAHITRLSYSSQVIRAIGVMTTTGMYSMWDLFNLFFAYMNDKTFNNVESFYISSDDELSDVNEGMRLIVDMMETDMEFYDDV
jgi:hypothetical protein